MPATSRSLAISSSVLALIALVVPVSAAAIAVSSSFLCISSRIRQRNHIALSPSHLVRTPKRYWSREPYFCTVLMARVVTFHFIVLRNPRSRQWIIFLCRDSCYLFNSSDFNLFDLMLGNQVRLVRCPISGTLFPNRMILPWKRPSCDRLNRFCACFSLVTALIAAEYDWDGCIERMLLLFSPPWSHPNREIRPTCPLRPSLVNLSQR